MILQTLSIGIYLIRVSKEKYLFSVLISFPESNTVLFCNILTLWEHLGVRDSTLPCLTNLLNKLLRGQLSLVKVLGLQAHRTLGVGLDLIQEIYIFSCDLALDNTQRGRKHNFKWLSMQKKSNPRFTTVPLKL